MPKTYFQWSRLTLSGIKRLGAKLPWRKEADTTMTNGTNIKTRKQIMNACAMVLRIRSFWLAVMRSHFYVFSAESQVQPGEKADHQEEQRGNSTRQTVVRT